MPLAVRHQLLIAAAVAVVFFTNLGIPKLWDRDEPRNAGCAVEMLQRGDWVTPYFNGVYRTHKPVLTYWLMMIGYGLFGVNEFAARFWSAVLGVATSLATYHVGRRLFHAEAGFWAALALGTSMMFGIASRAATPDASLIFCSVMAITVYVLATFRPKPDDAGITPPQPKVPGQYFPTAWPAVATMYGFMGLGILAKGPVGLILPTAVIGMFLLIMRLPKESTEETTDDGSSIASLGQGERSFARWAWIAAIALALCAIDRLWLGPLKTFALAAACLTAYGIWKPRSLAGKLIAPFEPRHFLATCWHMRPLTAIGVALVVALPWYAWVGVRTDGVWLHDFFWTHNFGRATQAFEGHRGTFLFYPVATLAGFFPWSIFALPMLIGLAARIRRRDPWMISYVFAACWLGVYFGMFSLAKTKLPSYVTPAYPALGLLAGAFVFHWRRGTQVVTWPWPRLAFGALAASGVLLMAAAAVVSSLFLPGEHWLAIVGLIPILTAAGALIFAERKQPIPSAATMAVGSVVLATVLFAFVSVRVSHHQHIQQLISAATYASDDPHLAGYDVHEPSWVFYSGRLIDHLGGRDPKRVGEFISGNPDAFVIVSEKSLPKVEPHLPPGVEPLARQRFFMKKYDVILLGRTREGVRAARQQTGSTRLR